MILSNNLVHILSDWIMDTFSYTSPEQDIVVLEIDEFILGSLYSPLTEEEYNILKKFDRAVITMYADGEHKSDLQIVDYEFSITPKNMGTTKWNTSMSLISSWHYKGMLTIV